jgi:hypothetical protein
MQLFKEEEDYGMLPEDRKKAALKRVQRTDCKPKLKKC